MNHIVSVALSRVAAQDVVPWLEETSCCNMNAPLAKSPDATFVELSSEDARNLQMLMGGILNEGVNCTNMRHIVHASLCALSTFSDEMLVNSF